MCENALAEFMSPQKPPDPAKCNRMGVRGDACTLERLIEGYRTTGDEKFLTRARWQIANCAFNGRADIAELRTIAVGEGMVALPADGVRLASAGLTTLAEVFRVWRG